MKTVPGTTALGEDELGNSATYPLAPFQWEGRTGVRERDDAASLLANDALENAA